MTLRDEFLTWERDFEHFESRLRYRYGDELPTFERPLRNEDVPEDLLTIGLVGGTGVGKSSLINALAKREVSASSSRRPTTARIIPYLHRERAHELEKMSFLRDFLSEDRVHHDAEAVRDLALFDLPDIDSSESSHAEVVAACLEGLDIVVWVTSLTKFGDRLFHEWIHRYRRIMDPENFVFVLNKVDEIDDSDGSEAVSVLKKNFRNQIAESLGEKVSADSISVFLVSATANENESPVPGNAFADFREQLFRERSERELAKIKRSNRGAEFGRRLAHLNEYLDCAGRESWLDGDAEFTRTRVDEELAREEVQEELQQVLRASPVQDNLTKEYFQLSLRRWPLLSKLSWLTAPFRQIPRVLENLAAIARLQFGAEEEPSTGPRDALSRAFSEIEADRRRRRSRLADPKIAIRLENPSDRALDRRRVRLQNECDARLEEALATKRGSRRETSKPRAGAWQHFLVFAPLLWFPLLQPLLQEILDPSDTEATLGFRLSYRIVRIFGAAHLSVSLAFVIAVYLGYLLYLRAKAWARASRECRALLETEWWTETLRERVTHLLLQENREELAKIEKESTGIEDFRRQLKELETRVID